MKKGKSSNRVYDKVKSWLFPKVLKSYPREAQESNNNLNRTFWNTRRLLIQIQGFLENEKLRIRIEGNFTNNGLNHEGKLYHFITPFCKISLNNDKRGRYNITYFLNPNLLEIIGDNYGNILEARIYELVTDNEMKGFINANQLNCIYERYFNESLTIAETKPNYMVTITEKTIS
ncbi:hypothetical protein [Chryseobacterium vrystaatense]|uniref:Uncharacterized protein n=1 Tax=Chryseobacterium vrystaatense TaxID=307480 RepID=A0A1M5NZ57_9FLAO|nr:hypothetical protein [Chryseobacterium vrystaatense]KFF26491.1 hypothetical protein IW16_11560 [Chryseobacterium vrystaatense]SHG94854.1 hypothetical protein SAMN02787073_5122 [Chryseobacterium vrystaatense]